MKCDIILAGVGGQGILSIAAAIGWGAIDNSLFIKQAEVHGMSQRGGAVQSHLRISDQEISSDLIPLGEADIIISVEPMESLRYLPYLNKDAWLVTNSKPFVNIPNYPDINEVYAQIKEVKNHVIIDAEKIAKEIGSVRVSNIVMLGASSLFIFVPYESIKKGIRQIFSRKGEDIVNLNLTAMDSGRKFSEENR